MFCLKHTVQKVHRGSERLSCCIPKFTACSATHTDVSEGLQPGLTLYTVMLKRISRTQFTPLLSETYKALEASGKNFEIVYISRYAMHTPLLACLCSGVRAVAAPALVAV